MTEIVGGAQEGANGRSVPYVNGKANGKASYAERFNIADHFIGGNRLANAPPSKVKDFVAEHDGHTVITNVSFLVSVAVPFRTPNPPFGKTLASLSQYAGVILELLS